MTDELFLSLGSNIIPKTSYLSEANDKIGQQIGDIKQISNLFDTEPWGYENVPYFLNQCIQVKTNLSPKEVLHKIHDIEREMGIKKIKWGERSIDIDIVFYGDKVINDNDLIIPHSYMHQRNFVLIPLHQIASNFTHPVYNKNVRELLEQCDDQCSFSKIY